MALPRRVLVVPVLAAATALIAAFGWPVATAGSPTWQLRFATQYLPLSDQSQYRVVLTGRSGSWFFGGSNPPGRGAPAILRRAGGAWQPQPLPAALHSWIIAASAQSPANIWAVTYLRGIVLHFDGSAWRVAPRGRWRSGTQFTGIIAEGPASVWLFGASGRRYPGAGTWHWDGTRWTRVTGIVGGIAQASSVPGEIWAIGGTGGARNTVLERVPAGWREVRSGALAGFHFTSIAAFGPTDVWVAGIVSGAPELARFNGHGWRVIAMPTGSVPATAMCRDGHGGLWVVANANTGRSKLRHLSRTGRWSVSIVSASRANEIFACARIPGTDALWGAGKSSAPRGSAAAVYGFGRVP